MTDRLLVQSSPLLRAADAATCHRALPAQGTPLTDAVAARLASHARASVSAPAGGLRRADRSPERGSDRSPEGSPGSRHASNDESHPARNDQSDRSGRDERGRASDHERSQEVTHASAPAHAAALATTRVVLLLAQFTPSTQRWGWGRLIRGPRALRGTRGLRFAKVLGSGHEGGFGLRPSASLQALFTVFDDAEAADEFAAGAPVQAYRDRARECLVLRLSPYQSRGSWDRHRLAPSALAPPQGPIAALTRASIRLAAVPAFWRHAPPSQADLGHAAGCRLAIGLGEAPLLRQATFSVWDSVAAMDAYARSGAHLAAIRAAASRGFFSESMFVRFVLRAAEGTWQGRDHALA